MLPLEGITILSIEQAVATPFATRQLADLGARVIKLERPGVGDVGRAYDETVRGMASHFVWLDPSKENRESTRSPARPQRPPRSACRLPIPRLTGPPARGFSPRSTSVNERGEGQRATCRCSRLAGSGWAIRRTSPPMVARHHRTPA